jgi:hypothetical protein
LQPTTANDSEATNSIATKIANIFFINREPPFKVLGTWFMDKFLYGRYAILYLKVLSESKIKGFFMNDPPFFRFP